MKDKKVIFMGTPEFSVPILEMLVKETNVIMVVTQPDSLVGRKRELTFSPIKNLALKHNIEVYQPVSIKKEYEYILEKKPDIIITCAYGQIIPTELLEIPEYKAINVHASLLPKLRGGAPIHRAIINGYSETGITIMYMAPGMDDGDIITEESTDIEFTDNVGTLHDKLSIMGRDLLLKTLPDIFSGNMKRTPQEDGVTYAYTIKREDEHISFNKVGIEVYNHIRGLYPFPTGYALLNNEIIKICEAELGEYTNKGKPGEIINIYDNGIGVKTIHEEIIITKLKPSGKKEMSAKEFINGRRKENLIGEILC